MAENEKSVATPPRLVLVNWGPVGEGHLFQQGFHIVNDGGAAYEVTLEDLHLPSSRKALGSKLARIGTGQEADILVWIDKYSFLPNPAKWDLAAAMLKASDYPDLIEGPDPSVTVRIRYRDGDARWYRTTTALTLIRSQRRLDFGAPSFESIVAQQVVTASDRPPLSPLDELRALGLSVPIDEQTAVKLWAALLRVDEEVREMGPRDLIRPVRDAYQAIASHVVGAETPEQVLDEMIPGVIFAFHSEPGRHWPRYGTLDILRNVLEPCILEWKATRLQMAPTLRQNPRSIELLSEEELASHPEDPVGPNPCPVGHPAHKVWEDATREALLELFRFHEKKLATSPRSIGEYQNLFVESSVMRFHIWAKRHLSIVRNDLDARAYDKWLHSYLQASMDAASKACRPDVPREETLSALRVQLLRALKYWSANALEDVSAFKKRQEEQAASPGGQPSGLKPRQSLGRQEPPPDDKGGGLHSSAPGAGRAGDVNLLIGALAVTPIESPGPAGPLAQLSQRDMLIHHIVGTDRFAALTNADIMQDRNLKKRFRNEFNLTTPDAAKASLDRIRKAKGYLLSAEIKKKRSGN